jgi:hypothetical protein
MLRMRNHSLLSTVVSQRRRRMAEIKKPAPIVTPKPVEGEMSDAEIDRNLAETFPASDPPSWTLGTDHRKESEKDPSAENEETE